MIQQPSPVVPSRPGSNLTSIVLAFAALVAVGGLAFAVGRMTAPAAATGLGTTRGAFGTYGAAGAGPNGEFANGAAGRFAGAGEVTIRGTVGAVSADRLTLKLESGTSVEIPLDSSTTYHRQGAASSTDVAVGGSVVVAVSGFGRPVGNAGSPAPSPAAAGTAAPNTVPSIGTAKDVTVVTP